MSDAAGALPRRRGPLFALLAANAVSMSGNVAALVAIPWFVLQTTGSAARTGIVAAAGLGGRAARRRVDRDRRHDLGALDRLGDVLGVGGTRRGRRASTGASHRAGWGSGQTTGYVLELREGFAFLRDDRTLFALVAVLTPTNMLDSVSMVALPVYAEQIYGSAVSLGLMMGVAGAGSVIGALAFSAIGDRLSRRRVFTRGFAVATVWYPVAAMFPQLGVLLIAKTISGIATGPLNPVIDTVFFERVPDGLRGRVFGVVSASAWLAMPLGVLVAGPAIELAGLRATLLATGALYLSVVLVAMWLPALRGLDDRRAPHGSGAAGDGGQDADRVAI